MQSWFSLRCDPLVGQQCFSNGQFHTYGQHKLNLVALKKMRLKHLVCMEGGINLDRIWGWGAYDQNILFKRFSKNQ